MAITLVDFPDAVFMDEEEVNWEANQRQEIDNTPKITRSSRILEDESPHELSTPEDCARYIEQFFKDTEMSIGGPILLPQLLSDRNVQMVLRLELSECIDFFHQCLKDNANEENKYLKDRVRCELFFNLQCKASQLGIPKHHSGGLLLIYLIFCKGFEL